jgi:DNA-damage-inducible protein J
MAILNLQNLSYITRIDIVSTIIDNIHKLKGDVMAQTSVNIRMDETVKRQFDEVCSDLGLNMSSAVNVFAKTVGRQKRIPFELSVDPFWSAQNQEYLRGAITDLEAGKGAAHELIEADNG